MWIGVRCAGLMPSLSLRDFCYVLVRGVCGLRTGTVNLVTVFAYCSGMGPVVLKL
jgi:hypothetical protein